MPWSLFTHQEPDGTFEDITKEAGLIRRRWGMANGSIEMLHDVAGDHIYTGVKGKGIQERKPLPPLARQSGEVSATR
jgi:hypothetical protein